MARKRRRAKRINPVTRETILAYIVDTGASAARAAEKFGVNPNTVRSWVSRARDKTQHGRASQKEAEVAEKSRVKANRRARAAERGETPPAKQPTGELVLGRLQGATRRILIFMDSDAVIADGRKTSALARALVDLTRVAPELRQMHRGEEGGEDLDEESARVAHALGLKVPRKR